MLTRLGFAVIAAAALLAACSSGDGRQQPGRDDLTRSDEAEGVTVEATWLTEETLGDVAVDTSRYPLDEFVLLDLTLDTHSGDLSEIDMERAAVLKQNGDEVKPQGWLARSEDSHHRAGVLVFLRPAQDGPAELAFVHEEHQVALRWEAPPLT